MESTKPYEIVVCAIIFLVAFTKILLLLWSAVGELENGWFSNRRSKREYKELPPNILIQIFSALPMTSIPSLMLVCKEWHNVLDDPYNLKLLHCMAYENLERNPSYLFIGPDRIPVFMLQDLGNNNPKVTNLNGVVSKWGMPCSSTVAWSSGFYLRFYDDQHSLLYLCNPLIGKRVQLPKIPRPYYNPDKSGYAWEIFGLAIDLTNANFCKAVRISSYNWRANDDERLVECEVYTLGNNSWRHTGFINQMPTSRQVYCNRRLYWRAGNEYRGIRYIVVFDIATERLNVISGPTLEEKFIGLSDLIELNKEVASVLNYKDHTCVYKLEDRTQGKWCMLYRFSPSFLGRDDRMILFGSWDRGSLIGTCYSKLCYLSPESGKVDVSFDRQKLNFIDGPKSVYNLTPYFPSLLHPKLFWAH